MKLSQMQVGQVAVVVDNINFASVKNRLDTLGLTKGVKITIVRKAILNGPIQIKLRNFYLAIRKNIADNILVKYE